MVLVLRSALLTLQKSMKLGQKSVCITWSHAIGDHIVVMESLDPTPYRSQSSYIIGKYRSSEYGVGIFSIGGMICLKSQPRLVACFISCRLWRRPPVLRTSGSDGGANGISGWAWNHVAGSVIAFSRLRTRARVRLYCQYRISDRRNTCYTFWLFWDLEGYNQCYVLRSLSDLGILLLNIATSLRLAL